MLICAYLHTFQERVIGFNKKSRAKIKTWKVFPLSEDCETKHVFTAKTT